MLINKDEKWVYDTLQTVSSLYLDTENIFNHFLPDYFYLNRNSIVFSLSLFSTVDTLDLNNLLNVTEVQINIQGKNIDEIDDIANEVIDTFHSADGAYCKNIEIGTVTSFYNELLSVHQTTILIYIRTDQNAIGSFSSAFAIAFD